MSAAPISPVGVNKPTLVVSSAPINDEPVELDGTPTSPQEIRAKHAENQPSSSAVAGDHGISAEDKQVRVLERASFHAQPKEHQADQSKQLAKLISSRKTDPAVLVDLPQTPQAEELAFADATDKRT